MTSTEFDRFAQLSESVKFKDEAQYEKQLNVVLENFGKISQKQTVQPEQIVEEVIETVKPIVTETHSAVERYAAYLTKGK